MIDFEQWCTDFKTKVPVNEQKLTPNEKAFYCLQGVSYMIDQLVNVGFKDILGVGCNNSQNEESESCWCGVDELCKRHPELSKSKVVSRQWRLDNDFPFKSGYKCRQMYYEPDVVDWINKHLRTNKC